MKMNLMKKVMISTLVIAICCLISLQVNAATYNFGGDLNHRVLDGSSSTNNKFYNIQANKKLTISGTARNTTFADITATANTTFIRCFEGNASGKGTIICGTTVTVGLGESKSFSASGTPKKTQCYMYCYKAEDDGYDLNISGTISQ